jgi:hypothetical protein
MQIRALEAEDAATLILEENEALLKELSEAEQRTSIVNQLTYLEAGALLIVSIITLLLYLKQKRS